MNQIKNTEVESTVKKETEVKFLLRLPDELRQKIKVYAAQKGMTMQEIIVSALEEITSKL